MSAPKDPIKLELFKLKCRENALTSHLGGKNKGKTLTEIYGSEERAIEIGKKRSEAIRKPKSIIGASNIREGKRRQVAKNGTLSFGRSGYLYKELQQRVFRRDNFCCKKCPSNKNLHLHHIKDWDNFPELRFEDSNCETLCASCHPSEHKRGSPETDRRGKSTKGTVWITNEVVSKKIRKEEIIPAGWIYGMCKKKHEKEQENVQPVIASAGVQVEG